MPGSIKKDLYIAKSIHDLNQLASEIPKVNNARLFATTAEKVYRGAEEAFRLGDEERSYVLYMKYFNVVSAIKKSADYKKQAKYVEDLIGKKNCITAITRAEELSTSLKTRYEEAEALEVSKKLDKLDVKEDSEKKNELEKLESSSDEKKPEGNGEATSSTNQPDDLGSKGGLAATKGGGIDVQTVYRLLKDPDVSLILMDVRSAEDFEKSHILSDRSISVPEAAVPPGCTVAQIERQLPATTLKVWRSRGHVDYIIMLDWRCSAVTLKPRSTLTYLKDALFKWDQETILRSEPLILEGGYEEWIMCYPSLTTNPSVKCPLPSINGATSDLPSLDTIDYDVELEFLQSPAPSPIESPITPSDEDIPRDLPPSRRPLMPLVDRRTKPKPSSALNNATDVARVDTQPSRIVNAIDNSDARRRPVVEDKTNNLPSSKTKLPEKNTNVVKVSATPEAVAPTAVIPTVDRSKKPVIGQVQPIGRQFSSSGSEDEADWPVARDERSVGRRGRSDRGKETGQSLEEAEMKGLLAIREAKDREVRSLAELMRMKKKVEEDMKRDEKEAQRKRAERSDSADRRKLQLSEEQRGNRRNATDNDSISSIEDEVDKKEVKGDSTSSSSAPASATKQTEDEGEPADGKPVQLTKTSKENEQRKADEIKIEEQERLKRVGEEQERLKAEETKMREQERLKAEELRNREREAEKQQLEREATAKREQEAARLKQQQEAARREQVEKELKEKALKEKELKEKEMKEKALKEKEMKEKERLARELEEAKLKAKQAASDVPTLPSGWERRLDVGTGKYYYIDHKMKKTYWDAPGTVQQKLADGHATVYKERLKEEGSDDSGSGGMKRSHSSPNIAKMIQDEEEAGRSSTVRQALPQVDRSIKPKPLSPNVLTLKTEVSEAKVRNLNPTWGSMGYGLTGLRNLGNTCYMNSTLQCLSNAAPLTIYFLTDSYSQDIVRDSSRRYRGEVASEYAVLIKAMWSGQYKALSPRDFRGVVCKMNSMFASTQHQDSHELLEILMNGLNEDLNKVRIKQQLAEQNNDNIPDEVAAERVWAQSRLIEDSIIVDLFRGQYKSTVTCIKCDKKSVMFESFMCLNLPIPSPTRCSLSDCLLHFSKEEKMMGDSQWYCPRCKCKQDAIKRIVIWKLPPILIVHLERFYYQGIWRDKITAYVDFPLDNLDMNRFISGPPKRLNYNLFGVSNHFGTLDGGHYTAYCKSPVATKWFKFDDQDVSEISKPDIKSSAAYMLFYTSMKMDQLKM